MIKEQSNVPQRKFAWADKWIKMTGELARIEAKVNNTYIVYEKDGIWVNEYLNGGVEPQRNVHRHDT